jgi:hypothetical protein
MSTRAKRRAFLCDLCVSVVNLFIATLEEVGFKMPRQGASVWESERAAFQQVAQSWASFALLCGSQISNSVLRML